MLRVIWGAWCVVLCTCTCRSLVLQRRRQRRRLRKHTEGRRSNGIQTGIQTAKRRRPRSKRPALLPAWLAGTPHHVVLRRRRMPALPVSVRTRQHDWHAHQSKRRVVLKRCWMPALAVYYVLYIYILGPTRRISRTLTRTLTLLSGVRPLRRFQKIAEAYEVLSDDKARKQYVVQPPLALAQ